MRERTLGLRLVRSKKTVSVAESCTGGLLGQRISSVSGSSRYFLGGVIAYSDRIKTGILGVSKTTLKKHGAVSREVALEMAQKVRRKFRTDYGVGVTGIAGPKSDGSKKPVGLVHVAVAGPRKMICKKFRFRGSRAHIRSLSAQAALDILLKQL